MVDRLENYCAQWNIGGEGWFSPFTMPTCGYGAPAPDEEARLADINVLRSRTAALLTPFREASGSAGTGPILPGRCRSISGAWGWKSG